MLNLQSNFASHKNHVKTVAFHFAILCRAEMVYGSEAWTIKANEMEPRKLKNLEVLQDNSQDKSGG